MVAAALTDLDDRLADAFRATHHYAVLLFIASASVNLSFPWPWLSVIGLTLSTSGFILLGGSGQRHATIAFGALLIAIYTMLGTSPYEHWYQQPMYLLGRCRLVQRLHTYWSSAVPGPPAAGQPGALG